MIEPEDLLAIIRSYVSSGDVVAVAEALDIESEDVAEIVGDPEIVAKAIAAKQQLLRLLIYGPLADALVTVATAGPMRDRVSAFKALKELAFTPVTDDDKKKLEIPGPTVNLAVLVGGGFDDAVRQLEGVHGRQANQLVATIDAESEEVRR